MTSHEPAAAGSEASAASSWDTQLIEGPAASRRRPWSLGKLCSSVLLTFGASFLVHNNRGAILDFVRPHAGVLASLSLHIGMLVVIAIAAVVLAVLMWRHPARQEASAIAGLILILSLMVAVYSCANMATWAVAMRDSYVVELARQADEDAVIESIGSGRLSISGAIGPHLMRDFKAAQDTHGTVTGIEITSEGGNLEQAMELATYAEAQRMRVTVRDYCLSACVYIAVGSPESYAYEGSVFGFHSMFPVTDVTSEIFAFGMMQSREESRDFLKSHGVPGEVLEKGDKHGPDSVHVVSAEQMVDFGAIRGLLRDGKIIKTGPKK
jgi:hypothetical protein